jgi:hypothetical protein
MEDRCLFASNVVAMCLTITEMSTAISFLNSTPFFLVLARGRTLASWMEPEQEWAQWNWKVVSTASTLLDCKRGIFPFMIPDYDSICGTP